MVPGNTRGGPPTRVTIVGSHRRVDLTVPGGAAIAEVLPEVVSLLGEQDGEQDLQAARWTLARLDGTLLDGERSLGEEGVYEGSLLYLHRASTAPQPVLPEDFVAAVAGVVRVSPGQWRTSHAELLLTFVAAGAWLAAAWPMLPLQGGSAVRAAVAAVATAGLVVLAALFAYVLRRPQPAVAAALVALPWGALAGAQLVSFWAQDQAALLAGACAGLAVVSAAAWFAAPVVRGPAAAGLLAGLVGAAAFGALDSIPGATGLEVALITALALHALVGQLPRVAAQMAGLRLREEVAPGPSRTILQQGVAAARGVLAWLLAGACASLVVALSVAALSPSPLARWTAAVFALAILLRARRHRFSAEVVLQALAAFAVAAELVAGLVAGADPLVKVLAGLALGLALMALGGLLPRLGMTAGTRRRLDQLELLVNVAVPPLVAWSVGVFPAVADWAGRL